MTTNFMLIISFIFIVSVIFKLLNMFFSSVESILEEGDKEFECGFRVENFSRVPFSMKFFSIALVFLIFDVEILISVPLVYSTKEFFIFSTIMLVLISGVFLEWVEGSLDWYF